MTTTFDNVVIYDARLAPGSPNDLSANAGNEQVSLTWSAPTSSGTSEITDYIVEYKESSSTVWSVFSENVASSTNATITGLNNLIEYDFRVFSVNSIGTGYHSSVVTSTPISTVANQPTNLIAVPGDGQVSLSWNSPIENGSAIIDYVVEYKKGLENYTSFLDEISSSTSTVVTNLTNGLLYTFRVSALNSLGTSSPSIVTTGLPTALAPTAPTAFSVTVSGTVAVSEVLTCQYTYADSNADSEGISLFRWLISNTADGVYLPIQNEASSTYYVSVSDLSKYIKCEVTPVTNVAPTNGLSVQSSENLVGIELDYLNHILSTGQSLSLGVGGWGVLSDTQPYNNLMLDGSSLVPLVETGGIESMSSGMANSLTAQIVGTNNDFAVTMHGVGGSSYSVLKKGTTPYQNGMDQVLAAKNAAALLDRLYRVIGVTVIHGESDSQSNSAYEDYLVEWQNDYETDVKAITGQKGSIPLFTDQMGSFTSFRNVATSVIPIAQLAASENNPEKIILVGPKYFFDYMDGTHLTAYSYRWLGEYYAKIIKKVVFNQESWKPLSPNQIVRSGNVVYAQFNVPSGPLVFDTSLVSARENYGFEFVDDSLSASIVSVEIFNSSTVKIVLDSAPTGSNQLLRYAYTGTVGAPAGAQSSGSAAGNLRDSDNSPSLYGNTLYNWSVQFSKALSVDNEAPLVSGVTTTVSTTSVSFAWETNSESSSIVDYGLDGSYGNSTSESDVSVGVTSHSVSISNLLSCTKYRFRVRSKDFAQNAGVSSDNYFTTNGCVGSSEILSENSAAITVSSGGSVDLTTSSLGVTLVVPAAFSAVDANFQIKQLNSTSTINSISVPTSYSLVGSYIYDIQALSSVSTSVHTFLNDINVTIDYSTDDIVGLNESSLRIYRWDGSVWTQLTDCVVSASTNSISCNTRNFSTFGLFGLPSAALAIAPTSVSAVVDSSSKITVNWSGGNAATYMVRKGSGSSVTGLTGNSYQYENLACGTSYIFQVKAVNEDLIETDWTSEISATTNSCGASASLAIPPSIPDGSNAVSISAGSETNSQTITLNLSAINATQVAISEDKGFADASWEVYSPTKVFVLSSGEGIKTIYVKFMSAAGIATQAFKDSIILKTINGGYPVATTVASTTTGETSCELLVAGDLVKSKVSPVIYAVNADKTKSYFPQGDIYKSWTSDNKYTYKLVSQSCITYLKSSTAVMPRPGTYMVKEQHSDVVYAVLPGNKLVVVTTEVATALYGPKYMLMPAKGGHTITINDPSWTFYQQLQPTAAPTKVTEKTPVEGALVKVNSTYYVMGGNKTLNEVTTIGLKANRFQIKFAHTLSSTNGYTVGNLKIETEDREMSDRTQSLRGVLLK